MNEFEQGLAYMRERYGSPARPPRRGLFARLRAAVRGR